jgi:hypothetical protein
MEPFEEDQLSQNELDALLRQWKSPAAPERLRAAVIPPRRPWWTISIRVPLPVACCLVLLIAAGVWRMSRPVPPPLAPAPTVLVRTERVEVPVEHDRVITKYVYRTPPTGGLTFKELRPVSELRPRIIRSEGAKN